MLTRDDVQRFLSQFFPKMDIWGIIFLNREKNLEALKELSINASYREQIIRSLVVEDFVETLESTILGCGEMWVFGKDFDGKQLYIKIAMGSPNSKTICISFHVAEKPIKYNFYRRESQGGFQAGDYEFPRGELPCAFQILCL